MSTTQLIENLRNEIASCGGPDKYLDEDEERSLFERALKAGLDQDSIESVINQMCRDKGWTREKEIVLDLNDLLEGTTKDDGAIDNKEFDHCVNFAVNLNMPRRRAVELAVRFVERHQLKIKKSGFTWFGGGADWFEPLRKRRES